MIKKKHKKIRMVYNGFVSLLKEKKILKLNKKKKKVINFGNFQNYKNVLKKKNYIFKYILNKKYKFKKYKKYKLLNLYFLKKRKDVYLNLYKNFFDIVFWVFFIFSNKKFRPLLNTFYIKSKKTKFNIQNPWIKKRKKWKKYKKGHVKFDKIKKIRNFIFNIFKYVYYISLLKYQQMFDKVNSQFNLTKANLAYYKILKFYIKFWNSYPLNKNKNKKKIKGTILFKENYEILKTLYENQNKYYLKKIFKDLDNIKKKYTYKILNSYKKNYYKHKKLTYLDRSHFKNFIFHSKNLKIRLKRKLQKKFQNKLKYDYYLKKIKCRKNFFVMQKKLQTVYLWKKNKLKKKLNNKDLLKIKKSQDNLNKWYKLNSKHLQNRYLAAIKNFKHDYISKNIKIKKIFRDKLKANFLWKKNNILNRKLQNQIKINYLLSKKRKAKNIHWLKKKKNNNEVKTKKFPAKIHQNNWQAKLHQLKIKNRHLFKSNKVKTKNSHLFKSNKVKTKKVKNKYFLKKKKFKYTWEFKRTIKKIKNRIKKYFRKFLRKKNNKSWNNQNKNKGLTLRLFYYDFFFNFKKVNTILQKNNYISILWRNLLTKTFLRFRLSEHIFFFLGNFNNKLFIKNKTYYILSFYKILVFLKKKLKILKKYLLKKRILSKYLKRNRKSFKYYYKKELFLQVNFFKNHGRRVVKYFGMLKYFNRMFYLLLRTVKFNIKETINVYSDYVYLSLLINLTANKKDNIFLVNLNNYFMNKVNTSFITAWLLNDNIFNYTLVYDTALKSDIYFNNFSAIPSLGKRNLEKTFFMIPSIIKGLNLQYTYFFGKAFNINKQQKYIYHLFWFYYIKIYLTFSKYMNQIYTKIYLLNFTKFSNKNFVNLIYKKILFNNNELIILNKNLMFEKKLNLIKIFIFFQNKIRINKLNFFKKKFILLKLFSWLFFYNFKQKYYFVKFSKLNYFLIYLNYLNKKYFTNFLNLKYFNNNKNFLLQNKKFFKDIYNIGKKNKYIYKLFFLNIKDNYYSKYSRWNKFNLKKGILHLVQKKTNNFLVLSLFDLRNVIGHTSAGQGLYRAYSNSKRRKKGTGVLGKIIFKKLRLRARKYKLKEIFLKSNLYWNFRINFLTKYWVLRYKLGVPYLKGVKLGLGLPYHKGLRIGKRRRT